MYFEIIDKLIAKYLKKLVDWQDNLQWRRERKNYNANSRCGQRN